MREPCIDKANKDSCQDYFGDGDSVIWTNLKLPYR